MAVQPKKDQLKLGVTLLTLCCRVQDFAFNKRWVHAMTQIQV